jgi:integrase
LLRKLACMGEGSPFQNRLIDMNPPGRETTIKGRPIIPMVQAAYDNMDGDWTGLWITYPTKKGPRPLKSIRMGFERARKRAGLSSLITPYTIRRALSTWLRKMGVPPWEIAGFLGHTEDEYEVTEDYAIYSPDYLRSRGAGDRRVLPPASTHARF